MKSQEWTDEQLKIVLNLIMEIEDSKLSFFEALKFFIENTDISLIERCKRIDIEEVGKIYFLKGLEEWWENFKVAIQEKS